MTRTRTVTVDVLIFVNGANVARVACDRFREDLKKTERFGEGLHGFWYPLEDAVPDGVTADVGVHFAETGLAVGNATFRLNGDEAQRCLAAPMHASVPAVVPGPRNPREMLGVLSLYQPDVGLLPLLDRLDLDGRSPASVWYSVFGEAMPGDRFEPEWDDTKGARDALYDWLGSEEFQANLFPIALHAFPEKRRVIFVHVPKCGGTHVAAYLARRLPRLDHTLTKHEWTPPRGFVRTACVVFTPGAALRFDPAHGPCAATILCEKAADTANGFGVHRGARSCGHGYFADKLRADSDCRGQRRGLVGAGYKGMAADAGPGAAGWPAERGFHRDSGDACFAPSSDCSKGPAVLLAGGLGRGRSHLAAAGP